ncbi:hypothetical protein SAMN02910413_1211 [Pseudobutyrivibrio sp. C4]|uniref:hypothetical protein n=1 Tax=Pseudobutyrivibrio sp. C4 TaxID=1520803 RepID=UPI0008B871C4|nr:hypothetical protein [Pseudobutyrivibrio sp. C4]SES90960.1 hypothetical protein SAMN02910413_1211 [Pseudobutyrivibrio sp. C4]
MNVDEKNWEETINCLKTTHTISIRQICKELKASRTWVNKFIMPNIDSIYLNSNIRGGKSSSKGGANWVLLASIALGEDYLTDSIWCNEQEYRDLITSNIISCTKQTKKIPCELLVEEPLLYKRMYEELTEELEAMKLTIASDRSVANYIKMSQLMKKRGNLHVDMLNELGLEIMEAENISVTERGVVPKLDYKVKDYPPINKWVAPHDIKDYGDTEESIYRKFFSEGDIRVEIALKDYTGKDISKKIYYMADDKPLKAKYVEEYVLVSEKNYQAKYKKSLSK